MKARLILSDGTIFTGNSFGAENPIIGEVVFNTGMTGYQEVLTDPSYFGQIVCMTYPIQGNYGINDKDFESHQPWVSGFIVREWCHQPSNWRCQHSLNFYLQQKGITGIYGIDTRRLTRILRGKGVMGGAIVPGDDADLTPYWDQIASYAIVDAVDAVSCRQPVIYPAQTKKLYKVALLDYGRKENIVRSLTSRGCEVIQLPATTAAKDILKGGYDGIMLSNGPGDPVENTQIITELQTLMQSGMPIFGICLGHQLLALAAGAKTEKLKYGHRGANHPVKDLRLDRTFITSQNHGYAVVADSVTPQMGQVTHINLNDNTVEGIKYQNIPVFSVQYHPEACPGPADNAYLFDRFIEMMRGGKR